MEEWKEYKLGEVLCQKGYIRGPFGSALKRGDLMNDGIPVYEQQHAIYNKREFRYFINEEKYNEMRRFAVSQKDIIISCSGTVGEVSLIKKEDPLGIISQALLLLRVDTKRILPEYLLYFFKTAKGHNSIISRSSGSVQVNIARREVIESIPLLLPSICVQKTIVTILKTLDDKIEVNRQINDNLQQQVQALYKSLFVDFEHFNEGEFEESELGIIPKGWNVAKLGELIDIKYGKDHKKLLNGNFPVYGSGGLMRYAEKALYKGESVLIPRKGTLNNVMYVNEAFWTVDTLFYSVPKVNNAMLFVYIYLKNKDLSSFNAGSAVPSMTTEILNNMKVIVPTDGILEEFNQKAFVIFSAIRQNQQESRCLSSIRDSLLPKLMSGELKIS